MLRCGGISLKAGPGGMNVPLMVSIPRGFLASKVCGIQEGHVIDVIASTGVTGGEGWSVGC